MNNQITAFVDKLQNGAEKTYYTITDIQGSVTEVYDESQNLVWKSGYTAFGILACEVSNSIDFDGLYTGCDYDSETGLTYHLNRWRSEDGGAWLSQDPVRDGMNWYGYVGQNPVVNVDPIGLFYYTGPTGSSQASSSTPVTPHEPTGPTGPSEPTETQKIPETPKQPNTVQFNELNKDNNIVTLTPDPDYLITKKKTTILISLKQKFQRALSKNASFNKPGKKCDTYCTNLYDDMDNKPSDWPSPDEYSVGPSTGNKKNYIDYYKNKTKKAPEDGISSVFMDGGKYVGQPHDVTIFKDSDGTIIKTEYTTVKGKRRVVTETYQNQKAFESAYGYKDFYYLSIEVVR